MTTGGKPHASLHVSINIIKCEQTWCKMLIITKEKTWIGKVYQRERQQHAKIQCKVGFRVSLPVSTEEAGQCVSVCVCLRGRRSTKWCTWQQSHSHSAHRMNKQSQITWFAHDSDMGKYHIQLANIVCATQWQERGKYRKGEASSMTNV